MAGSILYARTYWLPAGVEAALLTSEMPSRDLVDEIRSIGAIPLSGLLDPRPFLTTSSPPQCRPVLRSYCDFKASRFRVDATLNNQHLAAFQGLHTIRTRPYECSSEGVMHHRRQQRETTRCCRLVRRMPSRVTGRATPVAGLTDMQSWDGQAHPVWASVAILVGALISSVPGQVHLTLTHHLGRKGLEEQQTFVVNCSLAKQLDVLVEFPGQCFALLRQ
jgi:hypothetical protein